MQLEQLLQQRWNVPQKHKVQLSLFVQASAFKNGQCFYKRSGLLFGGNHLLPTSGMFLDHSSVEVLQSVTFWRTLQSLPEVWFSSELGHGCDRVLFGPICGAVREWRIIQGVSCTPTLSLGAPQTDERVEQGFVYYINLSSTCNIRHFITLNSVLVLK